MKEVTKKHQLHHVVENELNAVQEAHQLVMKDILLNSNKTNLKSMNEKMTDEHSNHANVLKEILQKHDLHHVVQKDVLELHSSTGVVVDNISDRFKKIEQDMEVAKDSQQKEGKEGGSKSDENDLDHPMDRYSFSNDKNFISHLEEEIKSLKESIRTTKDANAKQIDDMSTTIKTLKAEKDELKNENVSLVNQIDLLKIDKDRVEKHCEEIHIELTSAVEESNRLRQERLEMTTEHAKQMGKFLTHVLICALSFPNF